MGILLERIKLNNLVYGNGIAENFKANSLFFYNKYQKSDKEVTNISIIDIKKGGFYFIKYKDESNWMQYSIVFTSDFRKFNNMIIILAVNFNFIPLEIRVSIFDKYITEKDFERNSFLNVDYEGMYTALIKYGFEYALVEYNIAQIYSVHKICMDLVPRFLYSQYPTNKYDPIALYGIWKAKIKDKSLRNQEISKALITDFYAVSDDIMENYNVLKDHINRIQRNLDKFG